MKKLTTSAAVIVAALAIAGSTIAAAPASATTERHTPIAQLTGTFVLDSAKDTAWEVLAPAPGSDAAATMTKPKWAYTFHAGSFTVPFGGTGEIRATGTDQCLQEQGTRIVFATCDASDAEQQFTGDSELRFETASGRFLTGSNRGVSGPGELTSGSEAQAGRLADLWDMDYSIS